MASDPVYASVPRVAAGIVPATADTSLTAPTNATTIFTAPSAGTLITELVLEGLGTTVAGWVGIFLHDGSTYHLYDQFDITAVTPSSTVKAFRTSRKYTDLIVPDGWSLRATVSIAGNQSMVKVTATGGDLT